MTLEERFWAKVEKGGGCWLWRGSLSRGYGKFRTGGRGSIPANAHRVAWELTYGAIPVGEGYHGTCVCHTCDNRSCVRPDHLFLGSNLDNARDCAAKQRTSPQRHPERYPQVRRARARKAGLTP